MSDKQDRSKELQQQEVEANSCIALGAGVGALGIAAAALTGAVCPLCYFVAPGLVGVGLFQKRRARKQTQSQMNTIDTKEI